jgi:hypothetical protein
VDNDFYYGLKEETTKGTPVGPRTGWSCDPALISDDNPGISLRRLWESLLYIASVVAFVSTIYYAIPGFFHVFAWGDPRAVQPTHVAVSVIVFLVSLHFLPDKKRKEDKNDD